MLKAIIRAAGLLAALGAVLIAVGIPSAMAATPTPSINPVVGPTIRPTSPLAALTPVIGLTPLPTLPVILPSNPPALTIQLPGGWRRSYFLEPASDQITNTSVNVAYFDGHLQNSTATIVILWNYASISPIPAGISPNSLLTPTTVSVVGATPTPDPVTQSLWLDGLRLLQGTIVDLTCNVGHYGVQQNLSVGGQTGIGEVFAASQCQDGPDVAGWFVGVRTRYNTKFLFYVYVSPAQSYNDVHPDLQKILDSVVFQQPPTATPTAIGPTFTPTGMPTGTPTSPGK